MQQNFATFFKSLTILFFALLSGQIMFMAVVIFLASPAPPAEVNADPYLPYYGLAFAVICIVTSFIVYQRLSAKAQAAATLPEKVQQYRTANIVRWALLEGGVLVCLGLHLLDPQRYLLLVAGLTTALFFMTRPSRSRLFNELALSAGEQAQLDDPNYMVAEVPES